MNDSEGNGLASRTSTSKPEPAETQLEQSEVDTSMVEPEAEISTSNENETTINTDASMLEPENAPEEPAQNVLDQGKMLPKEVDAAAEPLPVDVDEVP